MVAQSTSGMRRRTPKPVEIPARAPWQPRPRRSSERLVWLRVEADRYEVRRGSRVIGFVESVGSVFVALAGNRYDRAVEVVQTLLFELAIATLDAADAAETCGAEDSTRASA